MDRTLIDRPALAAILNHSVEWLHKHMPDLVAKGFPLPVMGNRSSARWDPVAINRWLDDQMPPQIRATQSLIAPDLAAETAELERRTAALAAGGRRRG